MTYVSSGEQERIVRAMIKSLREYGGRYRDSKIYVLIADPVNQPCNSLRGDNVELVPLQMDSAFSDYPLAIKAFAAAQAERAVSEDIRTLIWLDPGVLVLGSLDNLDLQGKHDAAFRPVTLRNNIGIPAGTEPDEYWKPVYKATKLDYKKLKPVRTIVEQEEILPYFNCEVFSVNPQLGICSEWAIRLSDLLKDKNYQDASCNTFIRQLFLHQAVLSAVVASRVRMTGIKTLTLASSYPFNQHDRLPPESKVASLNELKIVIFDYAWAKNPAWQDMIPSHEPLKSWFREIYLEYLDKEK